MHVLTDTYIAELVATARQTAWCDDEGWDDGEVTADDFAGGNIDDAYSGGTSDGEILAARHLLDHLGISYV